MNYKVGDRVKIKSLDWYNENKNELGQIDTDYTIFIPRMAEYCGKEATIFSVEIDNYVLEGIPYAWTDEMIEGLIEEETKNWVDISIPDGPYTVTYDSPSMNDSMSKNMTYNEIILPEGCVFKDENGNEILTSKIILEKKKKEYPKTYEECCEVLFEDISYAEFTFVPAKISSVNLSYIKGDFVTDLPSKVIPYEEKLNMFYKLLICRDAYWKIAGEEMGLSGSWKPDFASCKIKYAITYYNNVVSRYSEVDYNSAILVFPTEEMRDAFKENFDPDIEICKELL